MFPCEIYALKISHLYPVLLRCAGCCNGVKYLQHGNHVIDCGTFTVVGICMVLYCSYIYTFMSTVNVVHLSSMPKISDPYPRVSYMYDYLGLPSKQWKSLFPYESSW